MTLAEAFIEAIANRVAEVLGPKIEAVQALKPRLLTVEQVALYLGRTEKSIRHLAAKGAFQTVRADGRVMFDIKDLDLWIVQNKVNDDLR